MLNVMDVADFFIATANESDPEEDDGMTNMKLNKLLFFAQAASLQRFGKPLFDAPLEAWKYGPVVKSVYRTFKECQRDSIAKVAQPFDWQTIPPETLDLLCDIYRTYARDYSAMGLMRKTHQSDTPWSETYVPNENKVIPVESIQKWAQKQPLPIDMQPEPDKNIIVAELDSQGRPFLPEGWEDD